MALSWPWNRKAITSSSGILAEMLNQGRAKSGAFVNHSSALKVTTVLRCVKLISEGLAQVPYRILQEVGDSRIAAKDHPLYWLLSKKPNDFQSSFEFFEQIGLHLALTNSAFIFKNIVAGRVVELLPYPPNTVTVKRAQDMSLTYEIRLDNGQSVTVPASNMWHIRGLSWNGWQGLETVKLIAEAIGLGMVTEEHTARMFSNGARVGGVLSTEGKLDDEAVKKLRASWEATQGGTSNAFKTAILWGGLKYAPSAFSSDESQLDQTRRTQVEEICRGFGVLPIMVGYADKTVSFASAEAMFDAHIKHTMMPWYRRIESSADINLLGMEDIKQGLYTKFNANGMLRGSVKDRGVFYVQMYNIGAMNPNEIRGLEDMNPYIGGEKYRVPLNMVDPMLDDGKDKPKEDAPK